MATNQKTRAPARCPQCNHTLSLQPRDPFFETALLHALDDARTVFRLIGHNFKGPGFFRECQYYARSAKAHRKDVLAGSYHPDCVARLLAHAAPYSEVLGLCAADDGQLLEAARFCCVTRRLSLVSYEMNPTLWRTPPDSKFWCGRLDMYRVLAAVEAARRNCSSPDEEAELDRLRRETGIASGEQHG